MKRFLSILLLTAFALGQAIPEGQENARKARALIAQAIEALGGQAYLTYQTKSEEGRFYTFYHGQTNSAGTPFGRFTKYPDKERLEVIRLRTYNFLLFTVTNVEVKDKHDIVLIHNGNKGYEITYKGTAAEEAAETADFLRHRQHSLDSVLREWMNQPGVALFYEGTAVAAGKPASQVTLMNAQNDSVTLFLDEATHLPIKVSFSWRDPADKYRNLEEEVYDNYKPVQGMMTPYSLTRFLNGEMSYQRFLNSVSYNQSLPDSLFEATVTYDPRKPPPRR